MARRTLAEAFAQSRAVKPSREASNKRLARAAREAVAPQPPAAAIMAYSRVMETYAGRVERAVERLVLSQLPIVGSGDALDTVALESGLAELESELGNLADGTRRSALAAGKRASRHGQKEVARMLQVKIPSDMRSAVEIEAFASRNVELIRKAGRAQVARIRKAIAEHAEGDSMRADIKAALWVSRNRGQMIARDQVHKFSAATIAGWAVQAGARSYVWHTRKDERVRSGHRALDGRVFRYGDPPATGHGEGRNEPGGAPACRCAAIPVGALRRG